MINKLQTPPLAKKVGLFRPMRHKTYRYLCIANFMANIGSWMQIFATGWLVTSQTNDSSVAALAQTLTQIPVFLFAVMGGVLADRFNIYRYLGGINIGMVLSSTLLAIICVFSIPKISIIFIFTFLTATGTALKASAWQATMSSLVSPDEIESSATLNGLSYNLSSIIGPVLGSFLFTHTGPSTLYFTNAICLMALATIYMLMPHRSLKPKQKKSYFLLLNEGVKTSISNKCFKEILTTTVLLFFSISTFQALLPTYVNLVLKADSNMLGTLMGGFGTGAVLSAFTLPTLRSLYQRHKILASATLIYGIFLLLFTRFQYELILLPITIVGGYSWAAIVSTMNSAAQAVFSPAIRARALSVYSMCFYGALTLGSLTWGKIAALINIKIAFIIAGSFMVINALYILIRRKVAEKEQRSVEHTSSDIARE
ncbi:TPA: MFS transporter [Klebsiella aerogenes]|uniref:MFS transporter n=1 Tax=Klebsiella aerogenes TaxID=548 RepID=UPI0005EE2681|nr:MFS transporter [Klebsiella aerogenes]EKV3453883.1 MFS transporter [Klebsiella aerogenes]EMF0806285.1 MFS transporter [Klebsiella aerogenes]KJO61910.1 hypothetical protein SR89_03675 [Klebsiella aerogenes]MDU9141154.1 MFS transporter [Klebsiella aerogenes]UNX72096.1 MFS transporter [Klebsiella aerogenes]